MYDNRHVQKCKQLELLVGRPTLGLPVYFFANVRHVQSAIPQICSEGSMFIPLHFHFSSINFERILSDGRHTLQVWLKRVTVLRPIRSNHLQTHRLFLVDPHQNTKMSLRFERGRSANSLYSKYLKCCYQVLTSSEEIS